MKKRIRQWFRCFLGKHDYKDVCGSLGFDRDGCFYRIHYQACEHCGEVK